MCESKHSLRMLGCLNASCNESYLQTERIHCVFAINANRSVLKEACLSERCRSTTGPWWVEIVAAVSHHSRSMVRRRVTQ